MGQEVVPLAFMLKTYGADLPYAVRLVKSFQRFNVENLPMYVVVPDDEMVNFRVLEGPNVRLISEVLLSHHFTEQPVRDIAPGYVNQEIVKLSFWELGLCRNYLCMDSDAVFIRDFGRADFMVDERLPYTFLTEDFDLRVEPEYFEAYWRQREPMLHDIQNAVGLVTPRLLTCHQHAVFSCAVLESLMASFMRPNAYAYLDLIRISPYEFSWYNMWLQKDQTIPIVMREPIFKTFHSANQLLEHVLRGAAEQDLARGFVGVVVNSGFGRTDGVLSLDDPRYRVLGRYVSPGELLRAAWLRVYRQLPSLQRLVARLRRPGN